MAEIENLKINPQEIHGNWRAGYALDVHTVSSQHLTDGGFDTEYTKIGEMVNQMKYHLVRSKIQPLAEIAANFVKEEFAIDGHPVLPYISAIIPIPPSDTNRPFQPVPEIAAKIGNLLKRPVHTDYLTKVKRTVMLKNLSDVESKLAEIQGAFAIQSHVLEKRCVLLFDDLYDSGTTLKEATDVLYEHGRVSHVLVLTLTQTRTGRNLNYDSIPTNAYPKNEEKMDIKRDFFWFRLFRTRGIGPKTLTSIAETLEKKNFQSQKLPRHQSNLASQFPELSKFLSKIREEDEEKVFAEYEELKSLSVDIIHPRHPDFPPHLLKNTPILFIKGKRKLLTADGVAIVGSRDVSDTGTRIARQLAAELAIMGLNVISGYAKGVDSEAHLGALAAEGTTTIVLPYGIKEFCKKKAFRIFNWQRDVLVVSQFDPDVKWSAHNAMARNKLVCALSKAVVVIESPPEKDSQGKMSGTFNTARTALDMKRPLFVLDPKHFDNPPKGNEDLIKLGGERLDPDGAAETIFKRISAAKTKPRRIEEQGLPEQLEISNR